MTDTMGHPNSWSFNPTLSFVPFIVEHQFAPAIPVNLSTLHFILSRMAFWVRDPGQVPVS